jgi:hypothetical protein
MDMWRRPPSSIDASEHQEGHATQTRPTNKNYLGNRWTKEVHDLRKETGNCQVSEIIRAGNAVTFSPDSLAQARSEGYDNCAWCLGDSTR